MNFQKQQQQKIDKQILIDFMESENLVSREVAALLHLSEKAVFKYRCEGIPLNYWELLNFKVKEKKNDN